MSKEWLLLPLMLYHLFFCLEFEVDEDDEILNNVSMPGLHFELSSSMDGLNVSSSYQKSVSTTGLAKHSFEDDILYPSFSHRLLFVASYLIVHL